MRKLIFIAVYAFCINAFAEDQMMLDHQAAAVAGSVPANSPAQVQPVDNQANNQNAANNQNTAGNPTPVSNQNQANTGAAPTPATATVNPDGTTLVASLDQNGNPITQVAGIDANNQQNPDNQGAGTGEAACETLSVNACSGRCTVLTNYSNNTKQCITAQ